MNPCSFLFQNVPFDYLFINPPVILSKSPVLEPKAGEIKGKIQLIPGSYKNAVIITFCILLTLEKTLKHDIIHSVSITNRLTFPSESIHFEETRNDLYITLGNHL